MRNSNAPLTPKETDSRKERNAETPEGRGKGKKEILMGAKKSPKSKKIKEVMGMKEKSRMKLS